MKNIPTKIYLQIGEEKPDKSDDFKEMEVTWCTDRIWDHDLEYVRSPKKKSIIILNDFQRWRTNKNDYPKYSPEELTAAIDDILKSIKA